MTTAANDKVVTQMHGVEIETGDWNVEVVMSSDLPGEFDLTLCQYYLNKSDGPPHRELTSAAAFTMTVEDLEELAATLVQCAEFARSLHSAPDQVTLPVSVAPIVSAPRRRAAR